MRRLIAALGSWQKTRLAAAGLLSVTVVPFACGLLWKIAVLRGRPDAGLAAVLVAAVAAIAVLAARLDQSRPAGRWLRWLSLAGWIAAEAAVAVFFTGTLISRPLVAAVFVLGGLWLGWAAWMSAWSMPLPRRLAILALLAPLGCCLLLLRADGLTGDGKLNLAWRCGGRPRPLSAGWQPGPAAADAGPADRFKQLTTSPATSPADDYPQFLGPARSGVVPAARLAADWIDSPPRPLWRRDVGAGWGGFAVAGERAVTQEQRGDEECVVCYRLSTGQPLWCHADKARFESSAGLGPRATPTITTDCGDTIGRVYTVGATGLLNCLELATGRRVWSVNILADNRAENLAHGVSGSPLVVDDLVIVSPTGKDGPNLAAYERHTGRRRWLSGDTQAGYGSPVLATLAGRRQIVVYGSAGVAGHEPQSGRVLWSYPWANHEHTNCTQPIVEAGGPDRRAAFHRLRQGERAVAADAGGRRGPRAVGRVGKPGLAEQILFAGAVPRQSFRAGQGFGTGRGPAGMPRPGQRPPTLEGRPLSFRPASRGRRLAAGAVGGRRGVSGRPAPRRARRFGAFPGLGRQGLEHAGPGRAIPAGPQRRAGRLLRRSAASRPPLLLWPVSRPLLWPVSRPSRPRRPQVSPPRELSPSPRIGYNLPAGNVIRKRNFTQRRQAAKTPSSRPCSLFSPRRLGGLAPLRKTHL